MDASPNPFSWMAARLAHRPRRLKTALPPDTGATSETKTGSLRAALREGPKTCSELAARAGIHSALVSALLKTDLQCGRVQRVRGADRAMFYELSPDFDDALRAELRTAAALLRRHGYEVAGPAA